MKRRCSIPSMTVANRRQNPYLLGHLRAAASAEPAQISSMVPAKQVLSIMAALLVFAVLGCEGNAPDREQGDSADTALEVAPDSAADTQVDSQLPDTQVDSHVADTREVQTDPGRETAVVPDATIEPAVDPAVDTGVVQHPISFILTNHTDRDMYLDWSLGFNTVISGERTTGGAWAPFHYLRPDCMIGCDDVAPNSNECCILCEAVEPRVRILRPGEDAVFVWDLTVFTVDENYCECWCYWSEEVTPMAHQVKACVYDEYECMDQTCAADEDGIIHMAWASGDVSCAEVMFEIPYEQEVVVIEIREP